MSDLSPDEMWALVASGSDELAEELDLPRRPHKPSSLRAIDAWIAERAGHGQETGEALDEEEVGRLGMFLARVLIESHGGGLVQISQPGHQLDGEWAVTDFEKGLARDYHVPFVVSATRIGVDRSVTAREWYAQLLREGKASS